MKIEEYIAHHKLSRVTGGNRPTELLQDARLKECAEDEHYASPPTRFVGLCRKNNYFAKVFFVSGKPSASNGEIDKDYPELNIST